MPRTLISGLLLAAAALLTVLLGEWLDLELEATALLGIAAGAVVALVPDTTAGRRLAGFALGVVVTLVGYLARAALLPDSVGGRAVFTALVVLVCVLAAAATLGRLALWSVLLGAATFAGAFEAAYDAAPPRVLQNATDTLTALVVCVAVGVCVGLVAAPGARRGDVHRDQQLNDPAGADGSGDDHVLEGAK